MAEENINTPGAEGEGNQPEKTFTQAELDAIVAKRLARATKGMPDETELTAFRAWKDSQQTEQQRMNALTQERDTAKTELAQAQAKVQQYEREKLVLSKGVPTEDVDYYVFKAAQLVSDTKTFEQAADEFIAAHKPQSKVVVNLGGSLQPGASAKNVNDAMNALIRGARK